MSQEQALNWEKVVAKHSIGWEGGPDDLAVLLVPRFRKGPLAKWLQPKLRRPHIRVKLDKIGSFVWKRVDGSKPFASIVEDMRSEFGETIEPAEERLIKFFSILNKDKFIELYAPSE
jgi:hypothetical protein